MTGTAEEIAIFLMRQEDRTKLYDISDHKEPRSDRANRYFHRLVGLLAKGEKARFYAKKNELILQYGNQELVRTPEGNPKCHYLPDDDEWKSDPLMHYKPLPYTDTFGKLKVRAFLELKGTKTYNSAEMAHLIECTRDECIGCGIPREEVETPDELRLIKELKDASQNKGVCNHTGDKERS